MATYTIGSDGDNYVSWAALQLDVPEADGDTVSFRQGETFREQITVPASGSSTSSVITYTAHGTGAAPIINGADLLSTWTRFLYEPTGGTFASGMEDEVDAFTTDWTGKTVDGGNTLTVVTTPVHEGLKAAKATFDGTNYDAHAYKTISDSTELYLRFYFRINATYDYVDDWKEMTVATIYDVSETRHLINFALLSDGSGNIGYISAIANRGTNLCQVNSGIAADTWYRVELHWKAGTGADGGGEIWVDGVSKGDDFTIDDSSYAADRICVGGWQVGTQQPVDGSEFYFDDVKVDTSAVGAFTDDGREIYSAACTFSTGSLWEDDTTVLARQTSLGAVNAVSKFYLDDANDTIYAWCSDGADPDDHTMEAGNRDACIYANDKDYITIQNLTLEKADGSGTACLYMQSDCDNITASSLTVRRSGYQTYGILFLTNCDDGVVSSCTVHDIRNTGIYFSNACTSPSVQSCTVYNCGQNTDVGDNGGICFGGASGGCDDGLIENCTIYNIGADDATTTHNQTILIDDSDGVTIRYNKIYDSIKGGIYVIGTAGANVAVADIYYNLIWDINVSDGGHTGHAPGIGCFDADDVRIYNNVVWTVGSYTAGCAVILVNGTSGQTLDGIKVKNNIIGPATGANRRNYQERAAATYTNFESDNNQFYDGAGLILYDDETEYTSLSTFQTNSSLDGNSDDSDPLMTNPSGDDFTLQVGSPCINAGVDVGLATDYPETAHVPTGHAPDIGAYEHKDGGNAMFF